MDKSFVPVSGEVDPLIDDGGRRYKTLYGSGDGNLVPKDSVTILRTTVGSTIHGTAVQDQDDRDEMAIVIEPPSHVIGLRFWETSVYRTQPEGVRSGSGDLDLVMHSLRKYCRLTANGNPTMLLPLFVTGTGVLECTALGKSLVDKRDMFLSQRCGQAFLGYMHAQRERLSGERGSRHGKPRQELINQYGFDTKYAGHVIRLGFQGLEVMQTGTLSLPMREAEREYVIAIRTGKITLNEVLQRAGELERELKDSLGHGPLPPQPDWDGIDEFLIYSYQVQWLKQKLGASRDEH